MNVQIIRDNGKTSYNLTGVSEQEFEAFRESAAREKRNGDRTLELGFRLKRPTVHETVSRLCGELSNVKEAVA